MDTWQTRRDNEKRWGMKKLGPTSDFGGGVPDAADGYSVWVSNGTVYTAPTVDGKKFGGHAYDDGGYEKGVRDCSCGAFMLSSSSGGPVDPFGPCPLNPRTTKALSLNLNDAGQNFAGTATIRAAIFDVLDAGRDGEAWLFFRAPMQTYSEDRMSEDRCDFVDAVVKRVAELQNPPHEGVKLENLCDFHKRRVLPPPSNEVCRMCQAARQKPPVYRPRENDGI